MKERWERLFDLLDEYAYGLDSAEDAVETIVNLLSDEQVRELEKKLEKLLEDRELNSWSEMTEVE
ncbi:MAG: hypothetical protein ACXQTD_09640 [Candidatus Syntropharchaeia archaeon]